MFDSFFHYFLVLHSWNRWVVLILIIGIITASSIKKSKQLDFNSTDKNLNNTLLISVWFQGVVGLFLYWKSGLSQYFLNNLAEGITIREVRFFGLEHVSVMLFAIGIITVGVHKVNEAPTSLIKQKTAIKWLFIGLVLILSSIPWSFSPLISRPLFRI